MVRSLRLLFFLSIFMIGSSAYAFQNTTSSISDSLDKELPSVLMVKDGKDSNTKTGSEEKAADNGADPRIEVNLPLFDAGTVFSGDTVIHDFVVKNTGGSMLRILSAKTSWGCTVTSYDEVIPPGSEGKVSVKVHTTGRQGSFTRSVTLETNDPAKSRMTLNLKMDIKREITIRPSDKFSWDANIDEVVSKKFVVSSIGADFLISKVESKNPEFQIQFEKLSADRCEEKSCYEMNITFSPKKSVSRYSEIITIFPNPKKQPQMPLRIYGKIKGSIQCEPESVTLVVSSKNANKTSETVLISKAQGGLKILDISSDNPAVKTFLKPIEKGKKYTLTVSVVGDLKEIKSNLSRGKITIKTAEEKQQELIIPYTIRKTN